MIDGASIGTATLVSWRTSLIVAVGIIAHDMSDGLNMIFLVTRGERPALKDYGYLLVAVAPMTGGLVVLAADLSAQALDILLGLLPASFCLPQRTFCTPTRPNSATVALLGPRC